jgi:alpha-methylacyl-CoA racemase
MPGPLAGLKILEFAGIGPCPLAGQILADLGSDVILIERKSGKARPEEVNHRGKRSIALNLKSSEGVEVVLKLVSRSDALIEGFRPGVMERLGIGPEECLSTNPKLVFGRMTGWGQTGPLAMTAGHDLNYLSITGALGMMGRADRPPSPPLNLIADYGGGTMFLLFGLMAALWESQRSGKGQVVDAAMCDGVSAMMGLFHTMRAKGEWSAERNTNLLDGGAPFYDCYETADGKFVSIGPLEPPFFQQLAEGIGLSQTDIDRQYDRAYWPELKDKIREIIAGKTLAEWEAIFDGSDACLAPVLTMDEAATNAHNEARETHYEADGILQAAAAPKFSRSKSGRSAAPQPAGASTENILQELGLDSKTLAEYRERQIIT